MPINVKKDKFLPEENPPIIHTDKYDVKGSRISYCIPISDENGAIAHYREVTKEEFLEWKKLIDKEN